MQYAYTIGIVIPKTGGWAHMIYVLYTTYKS